jgi:hypothetical protein
MKKMTKNQKEIMGKRYMALLGAFVFGCGMALGVPMNQTIGYAIASVSALGLLCVALGIFR